MMIDDPIQEDHNPVTAAEDDDPNSTSKEYVAGIRRTLLGALTPVTYLCITDVTDGHTVEGYKDGRALAADGNELLLLIVSPLFDKVALLQRQRMINKVLHFDLHTGHLHSIRMKCLTPSQWIQKGKPHSFRSQAPCVMNLKNIAVVVHKNPKNEDTTTSTTTTTDDETTMSSSSCSSSTTDEDNEECECFDDHDTHSDTSTSASSSSYIPPARMVARLLGNSSTSTSSSSMCACGDYSL